MSAERDWTNGRMGEFLDAVAARQPAPGGGSVAAAAGALAAALARMIAAYSPGKSAKTQAPAVSQARAQLSEADAMLRKLISEDAAAYAAYAEARKSGDAQRLSEASALAIAVPMEIAAVGCAVLRVLEQHMSAWNRNLISDAGVAAVLAEASVRAAAYNVRINLKLAPESDPQAEARSELAALLDGAGAALRAITSFVDAQL